MEDIIQQIQIYQEDHPEIMITDDMIKALIVLNINTLIEEIKKGVNNL